MLRFVLLADRVQTCGLSACNIPEALHLDPRAWDLLSYPQTHAIPRSVHVLRIRISQQPVVGASTTGSRDTASTTTTRQRRLWEVLTKAGQRFLQTTLKGCPNITGVTTVPHDQLPRHRQRDGWNTPTATRWGEELQRMMAQQPPHQPRGRLLTLRGSNLAAVLQVVGVDQVFTQSNNPRDVALTLGIEAARLCLIRELRTVFLDAGISVAYKHIALLADCITFSGKLISISRHGMNRVFDSVFNLASNEATVTSITEAAKRNQTDYLTAPSGQLTFGQTVTSGTGMVRLVPLDVL